MKKLYNSIFHLCEQAIKYIALLPLFFLFISSLLQHNTISLDIFETSTIIKNDLKFIIILVVCIPLLYMLYRLLSRIPEFIIFIFCSLIYLIVGIFMIINIETVLRHDSGICYWNALNFVEGIYDHLQPGDYFYKWPHQLGLVSYNCILVSISDNVKLVYFTNLLYIIFTNFFIWRSLKLLYSEKPQLRKLTIFLLFCFLPQFFYILFPYGQVPGLFFLTGALHFILLSEYKKCYWYLIPTIIFLSIAGIISPNYLLGGIVLTIILLLHLLKTPNIRYLLIILILTLSMTVPIKLVLSYYENIGNTDLSNGMPSLLYVAMGLQENEEAGATWRANGWFNNYSSETYELCEGDNELSSKIAMNDIKKRLNIFIHDPKYTLEFFNEKLVTTWCEPTYQSIWSGPLIVFGSTTDIPILNELYSGGSILHYLILIMNIIIVFIFGFSVWYLIYRIFINKENLSDYEQFCILFFLGGFIFHMFWETKSRYVYFYILMLIPIAAMGMHQTFSAFSKLLKADVPNTH